MEYELDSVQRRLIRVQVVGIKRSLKLNRALAEF